jgi:FMN phosphatase YigB (HAD superfamily)
MSHKQRAVIFDMDGTLANVTSIRHHLVAKDHRKDFHTFHSESVNVPPHEHVVNAAQVAHLQGLAVLVVTARKHMWRHQTAWWLALHNVPSDALFMRANHDQRKDYDVKRDILRQIRHSFDPIHAWDDNPAIIRLWEEEGIPCTIVPGWVVL